MSFLQTAGQRACPAKFRPPLLGFPNLQNFLKYLFRDDCRKGVSKDYQLFFGAFLVLLIPHGIGVGLEIDRAACIPGDPELPNVNLKLFIIVLYGILLSAFRVPYLI